MKTPFLTLILIVFLASLLRFYNLSINPPGLNLDEVAIGYNAYSVLKTGRDEYGKMFPLVFRSHDDYKPPLYVYLTIPSIALFGETPLGVRAPSSLLAIFAVGIVFFLVKELFPGRYRLALLSSFLLAISPWHIQFSRAAFETISTVLFTCLGTLLFIKKRYVFSAIVFGLELYLYQAAKVFVPLFIFSLFFIYIRKINLKIILFCIVFLMFLAPVAYQSTTPEGQIRFKGTSIFQKPEPKKENDQRRIEDWLRNDRFAATGYHPEALAYKNEFLTGYLSHFRPDFLFIGKWGPPINYIPDIGLIYLWELPFLLIGFFFLWKKKDKRPAYLLTAWLLLAPIPAALTAQVPSSIRTAIILPTFQIISSLGILVVVNKWIWIKLPIVIVSSIFLLFMLHMNFVHAPKEFSSAWFYSYDRIVSETAKIGSDYDRIIVSTKLRQPQNFFAFYLKYDPGDYLKIDGGTVSGGFNEDRNHFSKYYFKPLNYREMVKIPGKTLFVGLPDEFPKEAVPIEKFTYLNGETSAIIVGKK